ncbi:MAG TPA: amidase, partial [Candidatus Limnocylindrales bacterium]|nr:amidase [Candidatus Limnocylindrales bacterium]
ARPLCGRGYPDRTMTELWRQGASSLSRAYQAGETNPREALAAAAERIARLDGRLGAFTTMTLERAESEATVMTEELAQGRRRGPLHGIPIGIKELFDVEGAITTYGSPILEGRVPAKDAEAVRRLRAAGAIVVGLTRSHEFGFGITTQHLTRGRTRNPWNLERVPGGSSGGSAAAVAAGLVPVALASDTAGSIRVPAAFCGLCGLKPTYGAVNARGACALAPSFDHVGALARSVDDCSLLFSVLADGGFAESPVEVFGITVGFSPDLEQPALDPDHAALLEASRAALQAAGARLRRLAVPDAADIAPTFTPLRNAEAYDVHNRILGLFPARSAEYGADVRGRLEDASHATLRDYLVARERRREIKDAFAQIFREVAVLLTPVTATGPSSLDHPDVMTRGGRSVPLRDLVLPFTIPQDLLGLPACAVPVGFDREGMPVGVQITAPWGQESRALAVGRVLHMAMGSRDRWPPLVDPVRAGA